ncbi:MAG: hypothetical protein CM15mP49_16160 [Actinomycetota bacterium]|nr:MAG: hypothetical protein CM15mP49_16160 [Actinomycetota bacterium]
MWAEDRFHPNDEAYKYIANNLWTSLVKIYLYKSIKIIIATTLTLKCPRFLLSSTRFFCFDALGFDGTLFGSVLRFLSTSDVNFSIAKSLFAFENGILKPLFLLWDQVAEQAIPSPYQKNETVSVILHVNSTRVLTLFECCPPGPPDFVYRNESSLRSISDEFQFIDTE